MTSYTQPLEPVSRPRVRMLAALSLVGRPELEAAAYLAVIPPALYLGVAIAAAILAHL